jgi:hypothetical protein
MSPVQICNGLGAYDSGLMKYRTLRSYFGCFAVLASREAARRARGIRLDERGVAVRPEELARLVGISAKAAACDLRRLAKVGLLIRSPDRVRVSTQVLACAEELLDRASPTRSRTRPIPVPRAVLRFLARSKRPALAKVLLAYCLRGLALERGTGEVRGRGTVKASWIAATFSLSLRAAKGGRASLVRLRLIAKDEGSSQHKLNRDGAYFELNLAWSCPGSAPRPARTGAGSAPPIERPRTPSDLENQRTSRAGVLSGPDLGNVQIEDLGRFTRMEGLFWQAVDQRLVGGSEMDALNFLAASLRARHGNVRDPVRAFVGIVRRGLWAHITCAEEERARAALARHRELCPNAFRVRPAREAECRATTTARDHQAV